ncbi:ABC transporter ATP-binding protein [Candidatus Contubernalis alkaliaceticus]|uniref:ABC transporter ATP-binding protein n=1 Tax=Candidatus Contubernalis alkaliaceticus TaxID=338645 RepID=UPI001F4C1039|nr:ABC transporter ATP-binding protein [Candidatus Contubernalis alkalaceticus]UNC92005.1 ABC transporter ATP-binding protein [Candidatus Contubernalis alkalaceticus]
MITVRQLAFSYDQRKDFIKGMSFDVNKGEIFGFLGPSGAGKSTLQKILSGILRNYRGRVKVLNTEVKNRKNSFYENIGVDFEFPNLYGKFTALENLLFFSSLYNKKSQDPMPYLERVGLSADANKKVSSFSKGMKMRLAFVRAILHNPLLLFLDEPTSGLDPVYNRILKDMILEQKREGKTIILTTHNMHDAEELCDRVAFIVDGEIKALDSPHALRSKKSGVEVSYTYVEEGREKTGAAMLTSLYQDPVFMNNLQGSSLTGIHSKEPTLDDVFIELTGRCLK